MSQPDANVMVLAPYDEIDREVPCDLRFKPGAGKVLVGMHDIDGRLGNINVPKIGRLGSGKFGARVGVVYAVGEPDYDRTDGTPVPIEPKVGDVVGVRPYRGHWFEAGTDIGGVSYDRQLRVFGANDWWFNEIPFRFEGNAILPYHDWVVIQREPRSSANGIQLPDASSVPAKGFRAMLDDLQDAIDCYAEGGDIQKVLDLANEEATYMYRASYDWLRRKGWSEFEAREYAADAAVSAVTGLAKSSVAQSAPVSRFIDGQGTVTAAGPRTIGLIGSEVVYTHRKSVPAASTLVFMRGEDESRVLVRGTDVVGAIDK